MEFQAKETEPEKREGLKKRAARVYATLVEFVLCVNYLQHLNDKRKISVKYFTLGLI